MFQLAQNTSLQAADVLLALRQSRALTINETATLRNEVAADPTGRGYAGMDDATRLVTLCSPYVVDNPTPQPLLARILFPGADLKEFILQVLLTSGANPHYAEWAAKLTAIGPYISETVNMGNEQWAAMINGVAGAAIVDGLFTQEQWDTVIKEPDPVWQSHITEPARADVVLGLNGVVLELADVAALREG